MWTAALTVNMLDEEFEYRFDHGDNGDEVAEQTLRWTSIVHIILPSDPTGSQKSLPTPPLAEVEAAE